MHLIEKLNKTQFVNSFAMLCTRNKILVPLKKRQVIVKNVNLFQQ